MTMSVQKTENPTYLVIEETVVDIKRFEEKNGKGTLSGYILTIEDPETREYNVSIFNRLLGGSSSMHRKILISEDYTTEKIRTLKRGDEVRLKRSSEIDNTIFEITDKYGEKIFSLPPF